MAALTSSSSLARAARLRPTTLEPSRLMTRLQPQSKQAWQHLNAYRRQR
jgi:hypothetical protein